MKKLLLTLVCVLSAGLWAENYAVRFCGQNGGENTTEQRRNEPRTTDQILPFVLF